jgi:arylsulfatase A-like enzyme
MSPLKRRVCLHRRLAVRNTTLCAALALVHCDRTEGSAPAPPTVASAPSASERSAPHHTVILFVWDGLRPDSITRADTPTLAELQATGTRFDNQHAIYPSFTMTNAAAFATGAYPADHAYFGNTIYVNDRPVRPGDDSAGKPIAWTQPVFTEDGELLRQLDAHYRENGASGLLLVETLFHRAHAAGLRTAAVGKLGPVNLQDLGREGIVIDPRSAWPLETARGIASQIGLPPTASRLYDAGALPPGDGGNPTAEDPKVFLSDGVTPDAEDDGGTPYRAATDWLASAMIDYVLPVAKPDLCVLWLTNPDSTQHVYGPGSTNARDALRSMDGYLRRLEDKVKELGIDGTTDIIVASDHGHSSVSGPVALFPLRSETSERPRDVDRARLDPNGYSVSGDVRLADTMRRAEPPFEAYDGNECVRDPVLSGIGRDGKPLFEGASCTTPGYLVSAEQGKLGSNAIVVADNGGTEYLYVPSHDEALVARAVRFLQSRPEIGAIFVARRPGAREIDGTLPLSAIDLQDSAGRAPDVVASYTWDDQAVVDGMRGTEFASSRNVLRGMHGSFSPVDVHNVLAARGPSFRDAFVDARPTGNADVAPTMAHLLGLELPQARGRCLAEALVDGCGGIAVAEAPQSGVLEPSAPATKIDVASMTDVTGRTAAARGREYTLRVTTRQLVQGGKTYVYFDRAGAVRR